MKRPVALAALVIILLTLTLFPAQRAVASPAYSEKLSAYYAGTNAFWYMSFDGVNASASAITAVEGEAGVSSYNITLLKTTSWSSDFQVFGPNGYNLIPVPFVPSQGAFLRVGADSFQSALSAAQSLDSYLLTSFVSYSNSSGYFVFYSPLSFSDVAPGTLLSLIPTNMGGFASVLTPSALLTTQSPMVSLQGIREGSSFSHNLTVGSIAGKALSSSSQPTFLTYFGATATSLKASNASSSSVIYLRLLDGPVNSSDRSAVVTSTATSGSYTLAISQSKKVVALNVTVDQTPELLLARRVIDRGVLSTGQNVSVTMSFSNPFGTTAVTTAPFADGWWKSYGFFRLVKGNTTIPAENVLPGVSASPTYVLQYTGSGAQQVTVPPTAVNYTYSIGAEQFRGSANSNPVALSLGEDNPVVYAFLVPAKNSEGPVGSTQRFNITVKNVGTLTSTSDVVAGQQEGGLLAGSSITVPVTLTAQSLTGSESSKSYSVTYSNPSGQNFTVSTNSVPVLFTHSAMDLGLPTLTLSASVAPEASGKTNLTLAFTAQNAGPSNLTGFTATGSLPAGLACGTVTGTWVSCKGGQVTLLPPLLSASASADASMEFDLTTSVNYFFAPFDFHASTAGLVLSGASNAVAAPSGIVLTKQFIPGSTFAGMTSSVEVLAVNRGPFSAYNATVQSYADGFDSLAAFSPLPLKYTQSIGVGEDVNVTYKVVSSASYGNLTSSPSTASLFFGGVQYSLSQPGPNVGVFRPVVVSVTSNPASPTEGRAFSIGITIRNPSTVTVSNVRFTLPIPSTMALSNLQNAAAQGGNITVTAAELGPEQSITANATAQASSGVSVEYSTGSLSFTYSGATVRAPVPAGGVIVGEDVFTRYTLPSVVALLGVLATAIYVRRKLSPISPVTQR